jgi:hypothetical protein
MVLILVPLLATISFPLPSMHYARPPGRPAQGPAGWSYLFCGRGPVDRAREVIGAAVAFVIGYSAMVAALIIGFRNIDASACIRSGKPSHALTCRTATAFVGTIKSCKGAAW